MPKVFYVAAILGGFVAAFLRAWEGIARKP